MTAVRDSNEMSHAKKETTKADVDQNPSKDSSQCDTEESSTSDSECSSSDESDQESDSSVEVTRECDRVNPSKKAGFEIAENLLCGSKSAGVQTGKGSSTSSGSQALEREVKSDRSIGSKRPHTYIPGEISDVLKKKIKSYDKHLGISDKGGVAIRVLEKGIKENKRARDVILTFRGFPLTLPPAPLLEVQPDCLVDVDTDAVSGVCRVVG